MKEVCNLLAIALFPPVPTTLRLMGNWKGSIPLLNLFWKKSIEDHKDWPLVVDLAVFFLRNMPHTLSGYTPYELHYGTTTPNIISTLKSFRIWLSSSTIKIFQILC